MIERRSGCHCRGKRDARRGAGMTEVLQKTGEIAARSQAGAPLLALTEPYPGLKGGLFIIAGGAHAARSALNFCAGQLAAKQGMKTVWPLLASRNRVLRTEAVRRSRRALGRPPLHARTARRHA